jgi:hypothetical protein
VTLLRRVLVSGGLVLVVLSVPLVTAPGWLVEGPLDQPEVPDVWLRLLGAAGISLALFHVLILRKLDDLWWWCWALVAFDVSTALIALTHAALGVESGSAAWPWWAMGAVSALFASLYLAGLARAGQEKPFA